MFDIEPQPVEETHVDVGHPYQREPGNQVSAPPFEQHPEAKDPKGQRRDIVREAILAGEQVEEFSLGNSVRLLAFALAELARFAKNLFMRDRPGHACYRQRQ